MSMYKVTLINDGLETVIHHPDFNDLKLQRGIIRQGINVADSFTFTILPNNPGYNLIRPLRTLVRVENMLTGKTEFDGRILMPTESMSESGAFVKTYVCESELGYLNDSRQRHGEYHDLSVREFLEVIIENHNRDIAGDPIDKTFVVGEVTVSTSTGTVYRYLGYESTFDTIEDKLINRLGGELRVRKENGIRYLDYVVPEKIVKPVEIRLAKNLKSITKEIDPTEVFTHLVPLGIRIESDDPDDTDVSQKRLTIESVNDGKDYLVDEEMKAALDGAVIVKEMVWDDITVPSILKTRGEQYIREHNRIKTKYTITQLDLFPLGLDVESIELGYYYRIINPVMGIDEELRVIGKTIDIINPNQNDLTVGDQFKTAAEYQAELNKSAARVVELESIISRQAQTIGALRQELGLVDDAVKDAQQAIEDMDIEALNQAVLALEQAIQNLQEAIEAIPSYEPATPEKDGLMSASDKAKLDLIQVLESIDLDALKEKLNLISVTEAVDLDGLVQRVEALENEVFPPEQE